MKLRLFFRALLNRFHLRRMPTAYSGQQKAKIQGFVVATNSSEKSAVKVSSPCLHLFAVSRIRWLPHCNCN